MHAVALATQRLHHRGGVDVRSGAPEQVPVEHQEVHAAAERSHRTLLHLSRRPGRLRLLGRGVYLNAVVIADADARRRRALRDVVGGLDEVDAVTEASSAFEAARHARDASLILLDCSLPGTDVVDAIALVRRAAGGVPVIAVSAGPDPELVRRALDAGAMSFLSHTGPALTVSDAVSAALRGRGMLDPDVIRPVLHRYAQLVEEACTRDRAVIESLAAAVE